ncbi:MAG: uroporphyrinogen-III synthase [Acidimicrobiales bacterium]|nr:uroporphyrinogen-III synthase [Hyphomonadaceae bacterium]RZV41264.1 MAG: uroporphyrinogen-III synthase [Acidimicrobiales bacterium]
MKTVWITRTNSHKPVSVPTGWHAHSNPLLTVAPAKIEPEPPHPDDVIVFTSGNAVRQFCAFTDRRNWPVYTVGDVTAELARSKGFQSVTSAGKDVFALRDLIAADKVLKSKRLYYASGLDISADLVGELKNRDLYIVRHVLYETHPISVVPSIIKAAIDNNAPLTVFLYSSKGAQALKALNLDFKNIQVVSISAQVDAILASERVKSRKIAQKPTHEAMIKLLD